MELASLDGDQREPLKQQLLKRTPARLESLFQVDKCRGPELRTAVGCLLCEG